ncbi:uncharacterized protein LOC125279948 isoform X2 [Megalobrama amblycephala]|uniref:uncharacterized protein LOC125279948 isoform X2 n=1 Tax=Megalobrama amblycephala TaxID=75352 RepID=UPI0020147E07|nr:uncharacterized protein LOC125279948 isoform X2 [Megalobrama amblycephala]
MKLLFQVLLLSVMLASQKCQDAWILEDLYDDVLDLEHYSGENVTVPNITVYRQMEDGEHDSVIVLCMFDPMFEMRYSWQMQSFELSVESELNYTKEIEECSTSDMCVFLVTVSPPASFTCVHEIHSDGEVKYLHSQTYNYNKSVLDHHKEKVSLFYICFSSFIAVVLIIMTAAVIVTTIRSKAKDSINSTTTVSDNDYMDA